MSYVTIKYNSSLAKKTDYLSNPKGFNVKNDFAKRILIGTPKTNAEKIKFISEYKRLNPKFPILEFYDSDSKGNKISIKPAIEQPKQNAFPLKLEPGITPSTIPILTLSEIDTIVKKNEDKKQHILMVLGLISIGTVIYFIKKR